VTWAPRGPGNPAPGRAAPAAGGRREPGRARTLAARIYGVGPVAALAMTARLAGAGRFSSRKAVRFTGLDITVYSSDG